jgi:DNA-directed RNA polymerase subunit K/omega
MSTEVKKSKVESTTVTRNTNDFASVTGNIYEATVVISRRANQLSSILKEEINSKLSEFATVTDTLEEIYENKEQIEIAKHYEKLPKTTLVAIDEFQNKKIYFRNPSKDTKTEEKNI